MRTKSAESPQRAPQKAAPTVRLDAGSTGNPSLDGMKEHAGTDLSRPLLPKMMKDLT